MESGLCVELDPGGGNEVNFRAVLRAAGKRWGVDPARAAGDDSASDADAADDGSDSGGNAAVRARDIGEYDLNDDFIDDDELVVEDEPHIPARAGRTPQPEDIIFAEDALLARDEALPVLQPVDPGFYVNRGEIRSKPKLNAAQKKHRAKMAAAAEKRAAALAGVAVPDVEMVSPPPEGKKAGAGKVGKKDSAKKDASKSDGKKDIAKKNAKDDKDVKIVKPKPKKAASAEPGTTSAAGATATASKRALKQQALTPQGKLAKTTEGKESSGGEGGSASGANGESAAKKRRTEGSDGSGKLALGRALPESVSSEVGALQKLCVTLFGEKKPRLLDAELQSRMQILFVAAQAAGCAKLYSDLAKENRRLVLVDELWSELSKFLRTTRIYLEQLGHALHWGAAEKAAEARVQAAERALVAVGGAVAGGRGEGAMFGDDMDGVTWEWFRAKAELQAAKNQLASRPRAVKKVLPLWAAALKKAHFAKSELVTEQMILDAVKRGEDARAAAEKKRRDAEKEARRRRKDEAAAAQKAGALPKKIAEALPPGLRGLASLKARPAGAAAAGAGVAGAGVAGAGAGGGQKAATGTGPVATNGTAARPIAPRPAPAVAAAAVRKTATAGTGAAGVQSNPQFEVIEID